MKPTLFFLVALTSVAPLAHAVNPEASSADRTQVVFVHPENFTDVRDSYTGTESGRQAILDQIRDYMVKEGNRALPAGDRLTITVTDIDLAGDFEPWLGPQWEDVRIIKDIYPPRINLSFRVTDSSGRVIRQGTRRLTDLAYLQRVTLAFQDDQLRHEKELINNWATEDLSGLKR